MREDTRCAPESGSSLPDRGVADTVLAEPRERSSPAVATTGKHADAHTYGPLARSGAVDGANVYSCTVPGQDLLRLRHLCVLLQGDLAWSMGAGLPTGCGRVQASPYGPSGAKRAVTCLPLRVG